MNLTGLQLQVHPGEGLVAHFGTAVVVLPGPSLRREFADELLSVVESGTSTYGPEPGRQLIRKLAGVVTAADPDDVCAFAVVASADDGLAVMLCGSVDMQMTGPESEKETLSGRDVATWVDRVIRTQLDRLVILPSGAAEESLDPHTDLRSGTVGGSGITLSPRSGPAMQPPSPSGQEFVAAATPAPVVQDPVPVLQDPVPVAQEPVPVAPEPALVAQEPAPITEDPVPVAQVVPETPVVVSAPDPADVAAPPPAASVDTPASSRGTSFVPIALTPLPEEEMSPLPMASDMPVEEEPESGQPMVQGIYCSRGHFDDPRARFCAVCGISMVQQTHNLVWGSRPVLGVLVLDDGASFALDGDYVIGREPETSPEVMAGQSRPLVVIDPELRVSRVHARVVIRDWDVRIEDARSANGTSIKRAGSSEWTSLPPEEPTTISPGTHIKMGDREIVFDSHFQSN